ncbi:MAG TPA: hypothetical protein PKM43_20205 [Verrucomicrobiota bacterium]|nr:hypothetical protein [Verrucomicrobiota bacterium]
MNSGDRSMSDEIRPDILKAVNGIIKDQKGRCQGDWFWNNLPDDIVFEIQEAWAKIILDAVSDPESKSKSSPEAPFLRAPTSRGYWWFRGVGCGAWAVVFVLDAGSDGLVERHWSSMREDHIDDLMGEWCGPIGSPSPQPW